MLEKIYIKNFTLIKELELNFHSKLNIISGETGAGKSIIVDAIMILMGTRASSDLVREGSNKAIIEGSFNISELKKIASILLNNDIDDLKDTLIIRREIGKKHSRTFINDTPVQVNLLKKLGKELIDFHGQHDHQYLLKAESHLDLFDKIIDLNSLKNEYKAKLTDLSERINEYKRFRKYSHELQQKKDFLKFELDVIYKIAPENNEDESIERELKITENGELLFELSKEISDILLNLEDSAFSKLLNSQKNLLKISEIDSDFKQFLEDFETSLVNIEELGKFSSAYSKDIDFNPEKILQLRERYTELKKLTKKYGSVSSAIEKQQELEDSLKSLENIDDNIKQYEEDIISLKQKLYAVAFKLSQKRRQKAMEIEKKVISKMYDLGFNHVEFNIKIQNSTSNNDAIESLTYKYKNEIINFTETGIDNLEFYISTNKGESIRPLAEIASGGEISRIMLALKSIAAGSYQIPVLIFDEIDSGISGNTAQKVGLAMKNLAEHHQILSITHLPQICALGNDNIFVSKIETDERTIINASVLNDDEKLREVARLISGAELTEHSLQGARELIEV